MMMMMMMMMEKISVQAVIKAILFTYTTTYIIIQHSKGTQPRMLLKRSSRP
jgi:hypothetical protein